MALTVENKTVKSKLPSNGLLILAKMTLELLFVYNCPNPAHSNENNFQFM